MRQEAAAALMRAAVTTRPAARTIELKDVPVPRIGAADVLIRVKVCSICGTDLHIFNWDDWAQGRVRPPLIQGHEFAGEVEAVGRGVSSVDVGDYVSAEGHITCGHCYQCRTGQGHVCRSVKILGVDRDGAFAEYIAVPAENVWRNDAALPLEYASIQDPLGNAIHTAMEADLAAKRVAIFGLGPIGLMAIPVARALGASKVIAVGHRNRHRIDIARRLKADVVLGADDDVVGRIAEITNGEGVDNVLEMSGSGEALQKALQAVRPGGRVCLLGTFKEPISLDLSRDVVFRGITVKGITGRKMFDTWYRMQGLLRSSALQLDPIITHRFPFAEIVRGMETVASGNCGKVVIFLEE
jgi:threonine 3-dehydrogenase